MFFFVVFFLMCIVNSLGNSMLYRLAHRISCFCLCGSVRMLACVSEKQQSCYGPMHYRRNKISTISYETLSVHCRMQPSTPTRRLSLACVIHSIPFVWTKPTFYLLVCCPFPVFFSYRGCDILIFFGRSVISLSCYVPCPFSIGRRVQIL